MSCFDAAILGEKFELACPVAGLPLFGSSLTRQVPRNVKDKDVAKTIFVSYGVDVDAVAGWLEGLGKAVEQLQLNVQVVNRPVPGMQVLLTQLVDAYDQTLLPLLKSLHHKLSLDESIWRTVTETSERLKNLDQSLLEKGNQTTRRVTPLKKPRRRTKPPAGEEK